MTRTLALSVLAVALAPACGLAAPMQLFVSGIPSFDTNLGTLLSVTVTLDPPVQSTEEYEAGVFENFNNHNHTVNPFPFTVPGLDTYDFPPTPTNFVNPTTGQDHDHLFNLAPIVETYTGGDLAWFLDPNNGVGSLLVQAPMTSPSQDHQHVVNLLPVVPQTRFVYEPATIPEPAGLLLAAAGALAAVARRRR